MESMAKELGRSGCSSVRNDNEERCVDALPSMVTCACNVRLITEGFKGGGWYYGQVFVATISWKGINTKAHEY